MEESMRKKKDSRSRSPEKPKRSQHQLESWTALTQKLEEGRWIESIDKKWNKTLN